MGEAIQNRQDVTIPIAPKLMEILQGALAWKTREMDYVCPNIAARYNKTNAIGKNVGNNLVNLDMLRVIRWIGLESSIAVPGRDKKVTVYGFHSLRHSFASYCAEAGVPQATVLSILGAAAGSLLRILFGISSGGLLGSQVGRLIDENLIGFYRCPKCHAIFKA